jgi:Holliday junction DNA helicase RuvA
MISELRGTVLEVGKDVLVIETGGVGFDVRVTPRLASSVSRDDRVHVYARLLVREDGWSLYGFKTREERACFDLLLSVRGVGAKVSMSVVSYLQPQDFYRAVLAQDDRALVGVPGVGRKTAARMILELRDRIGLGAREEAARKVPPGSLADEALEGLMALGYSWQEAKDALSNVAQAEPQADLETMLREALRKLARP